MSYSSLSGDWLSSATAPAPPPFDYLSNGSGMAELQRVAADTVRALFSGGGNVTLIAASVGATTTFWVSGNETIAAIWSKGQAAIVASIVSSTIAAEERSKPKASRLPVSSLASRVVQRVTDKLLNNGDPAGCQVAFEASMNAWKSVYPVIAVPAGYTPTGWCERELIFGNGCQLFSVCKWTVDAAGTLKAVSAPPPPAGQPTAPPAASASSAQPPPTHAELDAAAKSSDDAKALAEFAAYMGSLTQARLWLTLALGIPATATDATLWAALSARGITPGEALDWFNGCNAELDCFRQRMNLSLGEADERKTDNRAKLAVGALALGAMAFAWWTYKGGRR